MIPIAQIKQEMIYSQNLADIIDVLKMISIAEFRNLSERMEKEDLLKDRLLGCFGLLTAASSNNPFLVDRKEIPKAFLLVCSDEGFLGEVNTLVADAAVSRGLKENAEFIVLGQRGAKILEDSDIKFTSFPCVDNNISMGQVMKIADHIINLFTNGKISGLCAVYMKFISFTKRHLDVVKLLPCDELAGFIEGDKTNTPDTIVSPSLYFVMEYLVKLWLVNNLYHIFWSSKLSEWSVRVARLEQSSDELKEVNKGLKFKYFKSIHALNDKSIREIFAGRLAA